MPKVELKQFFCNFLRPGISLGLSQALVFLEVPVDGVVEFTRVFFSALPKKTSWRGFCLLLFLLVAAFQLWLSNCHVHEHLVLHFLSHSTCKGLILEELLRYSFSDKSTTADDPDDFGDQFLPSLPYFLDLT